MMPTIREVSCTRKLPEKAEIASGTILESTFNELNFQYRLLREDSIGPLREIMRNLHRIPFENWRSELKRNRIPTYEHLVCSGLTCVSEIKSGRESYGMQFKISFTVPHTHPIYRPNFKFSPASRNFVSFGSLVLIVSGGRPVCFGTISRNDDKEINAKVDLDDDEWPNVGDARLARAANHKFLHRPQIGIKCDKSGIEAMLENIRSTALSRSGSVEEESNILNSFVAVVDTSWFAYEPVAEAIQNIEEIPLFSEIRYQPIPKKGDVVVRKDPLDLPQSVADLKSMYRNHIIQDEVDMDGKIAISRLNKRCNVSEIRSTVPNGCHFVKPSKEIVKWQEDANQFEYDAGQLGAFNLGLSTQCVLVHGPPGTGKSVIGENLCRTLTNRGDCKVLVSAYTNHALDDVLLGLIKKGETEIVRIGSKFHEDLEKYSMKSWLEHEKNLPAPKGGRRNLGRDLLGMNRAELARIGCRVYKINQKISELQNANSASFYHNIIDYLQENCSSEYKQFRIKSSSEWKIEAGRGRALNTNNVIKLWRQGSACPVDYLNGDLWDLVLADRQKKLSSWTIAFFKRLVLGLTALNHQSEILVKTIKSCEKNKWISVMEKAKVVGITATAASMYREYLSQVDFGALLCEEAGEILETYIYSTLQPSMKKLILIGDHQQLKPKLNHHPLTSLANKEISFDVSLFERLVFSASPVASLETQHRMRPEISRLIKSTYPFLKDGNVYNKPHVLGLADDVVFVNHTEPEGSTADSASKSNEHEAKMVVGTAMYLIKQGMKKLQSDDEITIIATYMAQVAMIRSELKKHNIDTILGEQDEKLLVASDLYECNSTVHQKSIRVSTIDNYQGEESDIILLSLVRSNDRGITGFVKEPERVNVMLSRAREGLVIFGNLKTLTQADAPSRSGMSNSEWIRVKSLLDEKKQVFEGLPVVCNNHKRPQLVKFPEDFDSMVPNGGCNLLCGSKLKCGHSCPLRCHNVSHDVVKCLYRYGAVCRKGHYFEVECSELPEMTFCKVCEGCLKEVEAIHRTRDNAFNARKKDLETIAITIKNLDESIKNLKDDDHDDKIDKLTIAIEALRSQKDEMMSSGSSGRALKEVNDLIEVSLRNIHEIETKHAKYEKLLADKIKFIEVGQVEIQRRIDNNTKKYEDFSNPTERQEKIMNRSSKLMSGIDSLKWLADNLKGESSLFHILQKAPAVNDTELYRFWKASKKSVCHPQKMSEELIDLAEMIEGDVATRSFQSAVTTLLKTNTYHTAFLCDIMKMLDGIPVLRERDFNEDHELYHLRRAINLQAFPDFYLECIAEYILFASIYNNLPDCLSEVVKQQIWKVLPSVRDVRSREVRVTANTIRRNEESLNEGLSIALTSYPGSTFQYQCTQYVRKFIDKKKHLAGVKKQREKLIGEHNALDFEEKSENEKKFHGTKDELEKEISRLRKELDDIEKMSLVVYDHGDGNDESYQVIMDQIWALFSEIRKNSDEVKNEEVQVVDFNKPSSLINLNRGEYYESDESDGPPKVFINLASYTSGASDSVSPYGVIYVRKSEEEDFHSIDGIVQKKFWNHYLHWGIEESIPLANWGKLL
eukprot:GHVH01007606.1.p1 GENE.GHVH01007606.1~~GHVH01007606.1.p1  ORF type:complete len:1799 (-),score=214.83 GHVH01007606.1:52-4785(-)